MAVGNLVSNTWRTYIEFYSSSQTDTQAVLYFRYGVYLAKKLDSGFDKKYNTSNRSIGSTIYAKGYHQFGTGSVTVNKTHTSQTTSVTYWLKHSGTGASWKGTSTATASYTVGAKPSYTVAYNGNKPAQATATPTNIPANQTKWTAENLKLSSNIPKIGDTRFSFNKWNTKADGTGTSYNPSSTYSANGAATLYAQWNADYPPSCDTDGYTMTGKVDGDKGIKNFTGVSVDCSNITSYNDGTLEKTITGMKVVVGTDEGTSVTPTNPQKDSDGNTHYDDATVTLSKITASGALPVKLIITDSNNKTKEISLGTINVENPTWRRTIEVDYMPPPVILGNAVLDSLEVYNYDDNDWDTIYGQFPITIVSDDPSDPLWTFDYIFDEAHVDDPEDDDPATDVKISYKHYQSYEKDYREAFFNTTRNQNFSNGIYNVMFVGGVEENPNFTSRVWWSQVNNPLYFPDTSYLEVGSNDTMVMGLTKVGDYLGVVKQSKTTDTAIFLVYPTSFDEETTYAVKQGVQGVGSLARYSFNILGDETLFLSPNGVMAIVPTQDEEHKVQNRSYFIDGQLLKETNIEEAYSFVFDGKYYLAVNENVYVLDGNQRNSWGNDKTNLVYECYYLDNVPARCFVKYNDKLVFSSYDEVCVVGDGYEDAYGYDDAGERIDNVPVKAEWSTVFDDDGALHYYKTMQKKGNLVSVLPRENETAYKQVLVDEETFNADKTKYFTFVDGKYVRCTEDSVWSADETYYIENRSNTKVYVRKDDKDPVEIQRSFGLSSDVPSEMFLKKKFKKYKRLQFIIKNEAPEPFGVDSIIKNYTIGNYAKK